MDELARVVLILLAAALVINLVKSGPHGVYDWASQKFLGRSTRHA